MITAHITEDGELVLPHSIILRLGARAGDAVDIEVEDGRVVLTPQSPPPFRGKARIIEDPVTGLPVLTFGPDSPIMTNEQVEEMLADFP